MGQYYVDIQELKEFTRRSHRRTVAQELRKLGIPFTMGGKGWPAVRPWDMPDCTSRPVGVDLSFMDHDQ